MHEDSEIMTSHPGIHELNERCNSDPIRLELWVASEWRRWRHVLRTIGKRKCIGAAVEAIGSLDVPCHYPTYTGTANLPYEVHDRVKARLYAGLTEWLTSDTEESRLKVAEALAELDESVANERAKGWFVICSEVPPVNVFASLAEAVLAKSSFEVHVRQALYHAAQVAPGSVQRFRQALMRSRTGRSD